MGKGLQLVLLGNVEVRRDAEPVAGFTSLKTLALLCYLAVTGRPHLRPTLAGLLWGELPEARAAANLRKALTNLRQLVGPHVHITRQEVALDQESAYWLDVEVFEAQVGGGPPDTAAAQGVVERLQEAVELYRGDFLEGFYVRQAPAFEEWALGQRARLRELALQALHTLVVHHTRRGEAGHAAAIDYATRLLALEPWREEGHRQLMVLLARSGQRSAALAQYETCRRVLADELGVQPGAGTTALYERIRDGQLAGGGAAPDSLTMVAPAPRAARKHNLPSQPIPLVGREEEIAEIGGRLRDPNCRLLTLVGPGGSGKTRLALEAAGAALEHFEHGVWLVSLASVDAPEGLVPTIAQALGLSMSERGDPERQLLETLARRRMLLVLDSFEHLLAPADRADQDGARLVTAIVAAAPEVIVLVTSRAALSVQHEQRYPVIGMAYPGYEIGWLPKDSPRRVLDYSAVRLFVQGARRMTPDFDLSSDNTAGVVEICRQVAGLPLAILLASAWVRMLSPAEIAAQLEQGLDLLATDLRDVPARQRSMRAVFDHSWGLLTERERGVMEALSVFRGGFTRQAARSVAGASLRDLRSLVDRSLVQAAEGGRYQIHELLRQYAMERLAAADAAREAAHEQHCGYYVAALERWEEELGGPRQQTALTELGVEIDNARAAWKWAVDRTQIDRLDRALGGLTRFYTWRARCQELEADCRAAAEVLQEAAAGSGGAPSAGPPPSGKVAAAERLRVLARVLRWQGAAIHATGKKEVGRQLVDESLALLDRPELAEVDTRRERASILLEVASQTRDLDLEESRRLTAQSLELYEAVGDPWWTAYAMLQLGVATWFVDAYVDAKVRLERSLALFQTLGDQRECVWLSSHLGSIAMHQGQFEEAEHLFRKAITRHAEIGDPLFHVNAILCLVNTLLYSGRFAEAQTLLDESATLFDSVGDPVYLSASAWNKGFADMHLGRWEQAKRRTRISLALGREAGPSSRDAMSVWVLGCLALIGPEQHLAGGAREAYGEARRLAHESLSLVRELRHRSGLVNVLAVLAAAELGLGDLGPAKVHVEEAVRTSVDTGAFPPSLYALAAAALLLAAEGKQERAIEIYALPSRYPFVANSRWFEDVFGRPIAQAAASLPPHVVAAAQERGRARDAQATLEELIAEWREVQGS